MQPAGDLVALLVMDACPVPMIEERVGRWCMDIHTGRFPASSIVRSIRALWIPCTYRQRQQQVMSMVTYTAIIILFLLVTLLEKKKLLEPV